MSVIVMIAEKDAIGKVKEIYTKIIVNIGIDFVLNMYKVMAVKPDYLESNWNKIKTVMHNCTKLDILKGNYRRGCVGGYGMQILTLGSHFCGAEIGI